ncbi:sugar-binding transcriptional regulator [Tropicimonas isoalkanivorans]|uniref:DNA-binding transcriptional regulator LsrR, DeoR family n=1 Tax=Tropicimonas isoalkanivorans TaxID=441112 RepID=A0A1I1Q5H0_9RHOB|nr:sugar-binding transcriptional regulator [Tropicimonas isoalkanivorans]SFD17381.1 DNA-binding transcriptional regulator LsrR, DeoR family [Tropicimonas isoalkanivorans]
MARVNELRLIARVAQMYHTEGRRQGDIAKHLHISQATVSRMLKKAVEEGIVRTTVVAPSGTYADLETGLRECYGLSEAIVVECTEDRPGPIMSRIGEGAAHFLEATLQPDEIIGVASWSETILKMVDNIHPMRSGRAKYVVQTLGGMGDPAVQTHATQLITRLARLTGAESRLLSAPGVAQSREAKLVLLSDTYVRETMDLYGKLSLAIVGIGAIEPSSMLARSGNVFTTNELAELTRAGAVGDMSLRFFDTEGKLVKTPLDDRVIGMPLEDLAKVDRVIALAGGAAKTQAIHAALKTRCIDVLITDVFTAGRLVKGCADTNQ